MPAPRTLGRGSDLAPPAKPGPDVYLGLLVLSLLAQILAALFLYMDYSQYPDKQPPKLQALQPIGQPSTPAPNPGVAPQGGALGGPPGGGAIGAPAPAPPPVTPMPTAPPKKG
jgi:hypothetical protein